MINETPQMLAHFRDVFERIEAVATGRAASGIVCSLRAWSGGVKGIKVALPSAVCHDVVAAVLASGCEPMFCDIDLADGLVPLAEWRRVLNQGAQALILVHLYGNPADSVAVRELCDAAGALLIDDAAQALGSFRNGKCAGAVGHIGVLSFGATKPIEVGGGVLLFEDSSLGHEVKRLIAHAPTTNDSKYAAVLTNFRSGFEMARAHLRENPVMGYCSFAGLLEGYEAVLWRAWRNEWAAEILQRFSGYPVAAMERRRKAELWHTALNDTGILPIGMSEGCVPWRFTCRLPGIDWKQQHGIAEVVRTNGHHISHWYLPAHWLLATHGASPFPATVQLAQEVFQFWVTPEISDDEIMRGATDFHRALDAHCKHPVMKG